MQTFFVQILVMIFDYNSLSCSHNILYDKLNYNLHPCNCTNKYICYSNNSILRVYFTNNITSLFITITVTIYYLRFLITYYYYCYLEFCNLYYYYTIIYYYILPHVWPLPVLFNTWPSWWMLVWWVDHSFLCNKFGLAIWNN